LVLGQVLLLRSKRELLKEHGTIWPRQEMHVDLGRVLALIHLEGVLSRNLTFSVQNCVVAGGDIFSSTVNSQPYSGIYLVSHWMLLRCDLDAQTHERF